MVLLYLLYLLKGEHVPILLGVMLAFQVDVLASTKCLVFHSKKYPYFVGS